MTMMTTAIAPAATPRNPLARLVEMLRDWQMRVQTRNELERLTDRELTDIGLNRADIEYVVNGTY